MMRELGCHILDADELAHRLIEPGEAAYDDVVREFGRDILDPAGRVDRTQTRAPSSSPIPRAAHTSKPSSIRASSRRARGSFASSNRPIRTALPSSKQPCWSKPDITSSSIA